MPSEANRAEIAHILPGTLDLLILRAVPLGPQHGYGVLLRIEQIYGTALVIEQGALYPALYRLEHQGLLKSEWGVSDNNRRAKFYELTAAGRKRLKLEMDSWNRLSAAMAMGVRGVQTAAIVRERSLHVENDN
jgi:transcriptional regulator